MDKSLRLGIDFGYKYTGLALLDSNKILDVKVLQHRSNISDTLQKRRSNRSQRRRKLSKLRRLRDLKALLKGMGIEPYTPTFKKKTITEREKASLGNRIYALAHYRGWDYVSLLEMLVEEEDGKPPKCPTQVKEIDKILIQDFKAPVVLKDRQKFKKENKNDYTRAKEKAEQEIKKYSKNRQSLSLSEETLPFTKIKHTCLGELHEKAEEIHGLRKKLEKDFTNSELEQKIEEKERGYQDLKFIFQDSKIEKISDYIKKRFQLIYRDNGKLTETKQEEIINRIMVELGLDIGEKLFEKGKIYRPHKNRHRSKMIEDLKVLMEIACGQGENKFENYSIETLKRLKKSKFGENILDQETIKKDWNQQINKVNQKAQEIAKKTDTTPEKIKEDWIISAEKIITREYRKKRFDNRNSMGKCPAKTVEDNRCKKNVPKKSKKEIRELQFEIELRQMNVKGVDRQKRKLDEQEVKELMEMLIFKEKPESNNKIKNKKAIDDFFIKDKNRVVPKAKNESRGKKDILKDIICGDQNGRAVFCIIHLKKKLELLKNEKTKSKEWSWLHEERVLNLNDDAPPSIKQKS